MATMDDITRLAAVEDIRGLKARYFRTLDTKDWEGFGQVFTEDARLEMSPEAGPGAEAVVGRAGIVRLIRRVVGEATSVHHGHQPEITVESATEASGTWAMEDRLWWPAGSSVGSPLRSMHGYGHYHERYRRGPEGWQISQMLLTRLRLDTDPPAPG